MKAHYLRVSTAGQTIDRQFTDSGSEIIEGAQRYKEVDSGRILFAERDKAKLLIEQIEAGNIKEVYVHSIDRIGRNTVDVLNTVKYFTSKGVNLISKQEGLRTLNEDGSENMIASMIIGILSTLSEWDYKKRRINQKEGIAVAQAKGKYKGRPEGSGMSNEAYLKKHSKVVKTLELKNSLRDTAKLCEVSLSTVQKVSQAMQETPKTELQIKAQKKYEDGLKKSKALHKKKNAGKITLEEFTKEIEKLKEI